MLFGRFREIDQSIFQRVTSLTALDTAVSHQTECNGQVLRRCTHRTRNRRNILETLAHESHIGIGITRCRCKDVCEMCGVSGCHAECRQCIRDNIRCGCEVFTGCGSKVHDTLDTVQHILGLPACHCHIVHGVSSFRCGEFCLRTHLTSFCTQGIKILAGRTGYSSDLAHGRIEIRCRFHSGSSNSKDRHSDIFRHIRTDGCDLVTGFFERGTCFTELYQCCMRLFCFGLQILKLLFGLNDLTLEGIILFRADWISELVRYILCLLFQTGQFICRFLDFPLQCIVFLLRDLTLGKLFIRSFCLFLEVFQLGFGLGDFLLDRIVFCFPSIVVVLGFGSLFACLFQCIQSCLGILHCLTEQLLFLSKQFRICRVELQQLLHIFELRLRVFDVLIHTLEGFG